MPSEVAANANRAMANFRTFLGDLKQWHEWKHLAAFPLGDEAQSFHTPRAFFVCIGSTRATLNLR